MRKKYGLTRHEQKLLSKAQKGQRLEKRNGVKAIIFIVRMGLSTIEAIKLFIIFVLKVFRMTVGNFIKIPNQTGNTSSTTNAFAGFGMNAKKIKS